MASSTTDALFGIDCSLRWRGEDYHNFKISKEMLRKLNADSIYQVNADDDIMLGW